MRKFPQRPKKSSLIGQGTWWTTGQSAVPDAHDNGMGIGSSQRVVAMQIKRILCPTDLSEASTAAIEQSAAIAAYFDAEVIGLHALSPLGLAVSDVGFSNAQTAEITRSQDEAARRFSTAGRAAAKVLIDVGNPASVILERAGSLPADLIVIGTHGASGFQHLVLGSVAEKVLRQAACPVLVVPPHARTHSRIPFTRLLCAVDFSEASLRAVRTSLSLVLEPGVCLTLLHALEWPWEEPPPPAFLQLPPDQAYALAEFRRYSEAAALTRLESLVPDSFPGCQVKTRVENGRACTGILAVAKEERSDLLVIGVRGRNPLDLALFGSTVNQVVRCAPCPVLTVP